LVVGAASSSGVASQAKVQKAVLQFNEPIKLLDVILRGEYIIVHDDERMAKGEPCTYVYTRENGQQGRLVVSFHCTPAEREAVDHFTVVVGAPDKVTNIPELLEYRFANSREGHLVPRPPAVRP
jgi:hypothetical protein